MAHRHNVATRPVEKQQREVISSTNFKAWKSAAVFLQIMQFKLLTGLNVPSEASIGQNCTVNSICGAYTKNQMLSKVAKRWVSW